MKEFYAVILAAGMSQRLGFNKLTVRIDGKSVIRMATEPFLSSGLGKVFVVTSTESDSLRKELEGCAVEFIENKQHRNGMSTSARAAIPYIQDAEGVFFHLGDKPFLEPAMLYSMADLYREKKGNIVVPLYEGKKGHPVLMDVRAHREDMESVSGDRGLREVIENNGQDVIFIKGNEGSLFDIDTVEEIDTLRKRGYKIEKG